MKNQDVETLRRLFGVKQQAAALEYKKCLAEQQRLYDLSAQYMRESMATGGEIGDQPSAAELAAANRFRKQLRAKSERLAAAAQSMDDLIVSLRARTEQALNREVASDALLEEVKQKIRAEINDKDEKGREQITLMRY